MMYDIDNLPGYLEIGHLNEKGVCEVEFDVSAWVALYPAGTFSITYIRPTETTVYPVAAGDISTATALGVTTLTWAISDAVTAIAGAGSMVVQLAVADTVVKRSRLVQTIVQEGHSAAGDPPEPLDDYILKWGSADATVTGVVIGEDASVTVTQDANGTHFAFTLPYLPQPQ